MDEFIIELGNMVKSGQMSWQQASIQFNEKYNENVSSEALRKRYSLRAEKVDNESQFGQDAKAKFTNGELELEEVIELTPAEKLDRDAVLKKIVKDPENWEIVTYSISEWMQHTKKQTTKKLYAVKVKLKPRKEPLFDEKQFLKDFKKLLSTAPQNYKFNFSKKEIKGLDKDRLIESPGIELHLGCLSWHGDTGVDYDYKIASARFKEIIKSIVELQEKERVSKLILIVGSDFFNSDNSENTTTKGTPQQNDLRWKKMFEVGVELWKEAIETLKPLFDEIEIRNVPGNHDRLTSYYLYSLLEARYENIDGIIFGKNTREVQVATWGKCFLGWAHGEVNQKRLIKSMPVEFPKEWGETTHREIHTEHLHSEMLIDDGSGILFRRTGTPKETDYYEYHERFIGAERKHTLFIWHKEKGLTDIKNIIFNREEEKPKIKTL